MNRLTNFQTKIKNACFVLSLMSIIEDYTKTKIDVIDFIQICENQNFINPDMFVKFDTSILKFFTNKKWIKKTMDYKNFSMYTLQDNEYTILKYFNPESENHHFKRRYFDTIKNSLTVKNGFIESVYIYEVLDDL